MNLKLSDLTWAGWLLLMPTLVLIVYVALTLGTWAATIFPDKLAQAGKTLLAFVAVGPGVVSFWVGAALLRCLGIAVLKQQRDE